MKPAQPGRGQPGQQPIVPDVPPRARITREALRADLPGDSLLLGSGPLPILPPTPGQTPHPPIPPTLDVPAPRGALIDQDAPTASHLGMANPFGLPPVAKGAKLVKNRYEVLETIGQGGMGAVYRALDRELNRIVALKVIHPEKREPRRDQRFLNEARAMAKLEHPGCVAIHDVGIDSDGAPYIVMELVDARPLDAIIAEGKLTPARAALLLHQIAGALHRAHELGIIHRDVKPANILVTAQGTAKLADFGVAKDEEAETLTQQGAMIGTLIYMPPEQTGQEDAVVDGRSDVYSLGATLYHCLVGKPPFSGTREQIVAALLERAPTPPRKLNPDVPLDLEVIALRCLEKEMDDRYHSAAEVQAELGRYLAGEPILGRLQGFGERLVRWVRRHKKKVVAAVGVACVAAAAAGGTWGVYVARARAGALGELRRGDALFEQGKFAEAEEAYAAAGRFETPYVGEARDKVLKARAWVLVREGEKAAGDFRATCTELATVEAALQGLNVARSVPGSFESVPDKAKYQEAVRREQKLRIDLARIFAAAETKFISALCLSQDRRIGSAICALYANFYSSIEDVDVTDYEHIADLCAAIASRVGCDNPLSNGTILLAREDSGTSGRILRAEMGHGSGHSVFVHFASIPAGVTPFMLRDVPAGSYLIENGDDPQKIVRETVFVRHGRTCEVELRDYPKDAPSFPNFEAEFRYVPAGETSYGVRLRSKIAAREFFIGKREVTIGDWARFWVACGKREDELPEELRVNFEAAAERCPDAPMRAVSYDRAIRFLRWFSQNRRLAGSGWIADLPTNREFCRATRGSLPRLFPWGNEYDRAFVSHAKSRSIRFEDVVDLAGSAADVSPFGVHSLVGGVAELTADLSEDGAARIWGTSFAETLEGAARDRLSNVLRQCAHDEHAPDIGMRVTLRRAR